MKKITLMLVPLLASVALLGCGPTISSTTTPESSQPDSSSEVTTPDESTGEDQESSSTTEDIEPPVDEKKISYENVLKVLNNALVKEALKESKVVSEELTFANDLKTLKTETFEVYSDGTSASSGKLVRSEKDKVIGETTFKTRNARTIDKILVENKPVDYDMFVTVTDYENDSIAQYKDQASKIYIVNSDKEAEQNGLQEGDYIVNEAYPIFASKHVSKDTKLFLMGNIMQNPDLGASGVGYMDISEVEGNFLYEDTITYSFKGDLNDTITETISIKFTLDSKKEKLLSSELLLKRDDVNNDDASDVYTTGTSFKYTISYDEKVAAPADAINVNDYFLEDVESVQMLQLGDYNGYGPVDSDKVSLQSSYVRAQAKVFTPSKAVATAIRPIESSNPDVITVDETGAMAVKAVGETIITFQYPGKVDGVYQLKTIKENVTVVAPAVESVHILTANLTNNTINVGDNVALRTYVSPSKSDQRVTATSDNTDVLTVKVSEGQVLLNGVSAGSANLTVASVANPEIKQTITITVIGEVDFAKLLTTRKYVESRSNGQCILTVLFNEDGTGSMEEYYPGNGHKYNATFKWAVAKNKVIVSEWKGDVYEYYTPVDFDIVDENANKIQGNVEWYTDDGFTPNTLYLKAEAK